LLFLPCQRKLACFAVQEAAKLVDRVSTVPETSLAATSPDLKSNTPNEEQPVPSFGPTKRSVQTQTTFKTMISWEEQQKSQQASRPIPHVRTSTSLVFPTDFSKNEPETMPIKSIFPAPQPNDAKVSTSNEQEKTKPTPAVRTSNLQIIPIPFLHFPTDDTPGASVNENKPITSVENPVLTDTETVSSNVTNSSSKQAITPIPAPRTSLLKLIVTSHTSNKDLPETTPTPSARQSPPQPISPPAVDCGLDYPNKCPQKSDKSKISDSVLPMVAPIPAVRLSKLIDKPHYDDIEDFLKQSSATYISPMTTRPSVIFELVKITDPPVSVQEGDAQEDAAHKIVPVESALSSADYMPLSYVSSTKTLPSTFHSITSFQGHHSTPGASFESIRAESNTSIVVKLAKVDDNVHIPPPANIDEFLTPEEKEELSLSEV